MLLGVTEGEGGRGGGGALRMVGGRFNKRGSQAAVPLISPDQCHPISPQKTL